MEAGVLRAKDALASGSLARDVLAGLWREAFAAGVSAGRRPPPGGMLPRDLSGPQAAGWRWGSAALLGLASPGARFAYGGVAADGPVCEREAVITGMRKNRLMMQFADTGEEVPVTVMMWARPEGSG